jgi:hypothetical protein
VDSRETIDGQPGASVGPGLIETGEGNHITIWKDAHVTDSSGCATRTFVVTSFDRDSSGTLSGKGLVVIIEDNGCTGHDVGYWQEKEITDTPSGTCGASACGAPGEACEGPATVNNCCSGVCAAQSNTLNGPYACE